MKCFCYNVEMKVQQPVRVDKLIYPKNFSCAYSYLWAPLYSKHNQFVYLITFCAIYLSKIIRYH